MITHSLEQGTPEWHEHRAKHFNASDAPAMLGISQYKTRSQLLQEMATGIGQEFDAATEARFADGHRFEALARPLAEQIIGEDLYPVTASEVKLSASFDGLTMDESVCFEHKSLNDTLRTALAAGQIPAQYCAQMEQQLMISGATKCLFMASKFDANDELLEEMHVWYESDQAMRDRIVHGWVQFSKDLESYQHVEEKAAPVAEVIMGLPSVSVQATGMVTASNLPEFKKAADTFIGNIKTELVTDEDFVNAEANVKFCKTAEDDLEGAKKAMLAQTSSINEVIQTIDFIKGQLASKRLMLDKLVKSEKENRKLAIIEKAKKLFWEYADSLETEIKPITLPVDIGDAFVPDFAGAMKGLKKLSAMQDAVDTALANGKIAADAVANDVRAKLAWCKEHAAGHGALFPDLQQIITKPLEDFALLITSRIDKHNADEAVRLEAERAMMQAEATAKAEREASAKLAEQEAAIRAEEQAKARAEAVALANREQLAASERKDKAEVEQLTKNAVKKCDGNHGGGRCGDPECWQDDAGAAVDTPQLVRLKGMPAFPDTDNRPVVDASFPAYPGDQSIIKAIQSSFGVSYGTACDWLIETAESLKVAA